MMKMKQENYAQKMMKMTFILFLNPLPVTKNNRLAPALITTKYKRHIELKETSLLLTRRHRPTIFYPSFSLK